MNLFFPRYVENKWWIYVYDVGTNNSILQSLFYGSFYLSFFIFAALYSSLKLIWIILILIFLIPILFSIVIFSFGNDIGEQKIEFDGESFIRSVKRRKYAALFDFIILLLWITSWYDQIIG